MLRFESPEGSITDEPLSVSGSAIPYEEEEEYYGEEDRFDHFDRRRAAAHDPFDLAPPTDRRGRDRGPPPAVVPRRRTNSYDGRRATQRQKEFEQHVQMRRQEARQHREQPREQPADRRQSGGLVRRSSHRSNPQLAAGNGLSVRDFDRSFNSHHHHRASDARSITDFASPPGSDRSAPIGRHLARPSPRGHPVPFRESQRSSPRGADHYGDSHSRSMKNLDRLTRSIRDIRGTSEEDYELINA